MEKNKIALVIPFVHTEEQYGSLSKAAPAFPFLGIAFIAKYLSQRNLDVDIYDFSVDKKSFPLFLNKINSYKIIGMPVFITTQYDVTRLAKIIKNKNPECLIFVGGPHVTLFPEDLYIDEIDIIIKGEGEISFYEAASKILLNNDDLSSIKGMIFKRNGKFCSTGERDLMGDLDGIDSPLLEKFNLSLYHPPIHVLGKKVIHTITSRGCPYDCNFCAATKIFKRKIRFRSIDLIIEELKRYLIKGYDSVMFYDDIFNIDRKRTIELCKKIISNNFKIRWMCFCRTDLIDKDLLNYMRDAGCYLITFGCESGNDKTLSLLNKGLTVEQNYNGIKLTHESGILAASSFMIGLPEEDYSDIERTILFAKESKLTFSYFPIFEPYKGTLIYNVSEKKGKWINDRRFNNFMLNFQEKIWVPDGLTRGSIEKFARKGFTEFYLRYEILHRIVKSIILEQPLQRKISFLISGIDYFLLKSIKTGKKRFGARF